MPITLSYGEADAGAEMSARLRRVLLNDGPEIDLSLRDGMNLVVSDAKVRSRLIDAWTALLEGVDAGIVVRAIVDSKLTEVSHEAAGSGLLGSASDAVVYRQELPVTNAAATDTATEPIGPSFDRTKLEARRETLTVQVAEAEKALEAARQKHAQAVEGLTRREEKAREALGSLEESGGGLVGAPELEEMRGNLDSTEKRHEAAKLLKARLAAEIDLDRANRHVRQAAFTRVALHEVEEVVSRRRGLIGELEFLKLIEPPVATGMERAFGAVTPENSVDPLANQLAQRWQEVSVRKASRSDHGLVTAINSAQQRLGMARAEFERVRLDVQQPQTAGGGPGGGLSVIEQALHLVLDEHSGANEAADRLRREMLDGPGPLLEVEGWGQTNNRPQQSQMLDQARVEVERLQVEVDQLLQQQRLSNTVDLDQVEAMLRHDVAQYLGRDPGEAVARELAKVRVIPAIQRAVSTQLDAAVDAAAAEVEQLRSTYENSDRQRVANTARKAGARSGAMRAVADVEAHRRETARFAEMVTSAASTARSRVDELNETEQNLLDLPEINAPAEPVNATDCYWAFIESRLARSTGTPMLFDNTFAGLDSPTRWELLTMLSERSDVQMVYFGESADLLDWADTCGAVTVGRI
jgi:hypothetical protein